jgi:hypothetical protein
MEFRKWIIGDKSNKGGLDLKWLNKKW